MKLSQLLLFTPCACLFLNSVRADAVANAVPSLSLDLVGMIADYGREWRWHCDLNSKSVCGLDGFRVEFIAVNKDTICVSNQTTLWMFKHDGTCSQKLNGVKRPPGIAYDSRGVLFAAENSDQMRSVIQTFKSDGTIARFTGTVDQFPHIPYDSCRFHRVSGICVHLDKNDKLVLYVCDNDCLTVVNPNGSLNRYVYFRDSVGRCTRPRSVAFGSGRVFVTVPDDDSVRVLDGKCNEISKWQATYGLYRLLHPTGIAYEAKTQTVFVCDTGNRRLVVFSGDGDYLHAITLSYAPLDVCADGTRAPNKRRGENVVSILAY